LFVFIIKEASFVYKWSASPCGKKTSPLKPSW